MVCISTLDALHTTRLLCPGATGKDVLQELVKDHRVEYQALTEDEKAELLLEYGEYKETRATGIRISTKSKVSDVTQTLKAVENEVSFPSVLFRAH